MQVNAEIIKGLNPCQSRLDNFLAKHKGFEGSLIQFLKLKGITDLDKIWVAVRVIPLDELQYFAIDCSFAADAADAAAYAAASAANAAYAAYAANAAYAAANAANAAYAAADAANAAYAAANAANAAANAAAERERQVQSLIYLCKGM